MFRVKPPFLPLFCKRLINVLSKNKCIGKVYQTLFKHCNVNIYLEMFSNPDDRVYKHFVERLNLYKMF